MGVDIDPESSGGLEGATSESKVGGFYRSVQYNQLTQVLGEHLYQAELLMQLEMEDGARLPDSGLLYVFAYPDERGKPCFIVHTEYC